MSQQPVDIQFALVSHTNNGKTTLARTLVGMDVGEVRDAAHVTVTSEAHLLQTTEAGDRLLLWDTPGFGDSVRLHKRLAMSGNPIGWFLREVFDRYRDRSFWLSQVALRAARDAADVVLYLVNSSEDPRDAGYLAAEMRILEWLGKPVVVLLNQLGPPRPDNQEQSEQARWKQHLDQYGIVRDVIALDAFARCWVHEDVFYDRVGALIEEAKRPGYARLLAAWQASNLQRFRTSVELNAQMLAAAARDSQSIENEGKSNLLKSALKAVGLGKDEQRRQEAAMASLVEHLERRIADTTVGLLRLHRLDPGNAARINARVRENFAVRAPIDKTQAGLLGAVVSGAATGLSADLMAGGLTLGGGALLGAIVGALTMAGAAWGFNTTTERGDRPSVQFADPFLRTLLVGAVLRYLAVAHFGRGRGNFVEGEAPPFWQAEVEQALARREAELPALWKAARAAPDGAAAGAQVQAMLGPLTVEVLERLYPETAALALARARI